MERPPVSRKRRKLRPAACVLIGAILVITGILIFLACSHHPEEGPATTQKATGSGENTDPLPTAETETKENVIPVPVLTAPEGWTISAGDAFDPLEGVSAVDETGRSYEVTVEGTYDPKTPGVYTLTFVVVDQAGERHTKTATLNVNAVPKANLSTNPNDNPMMVDGTYTTSKGYRLEIRDGIAYVDGYMLVNKTYSLPKNFSSTGDGTRSMRPEAMEAFNRMKAAAPANVQANLFIRSGVRNIGDQTVIFNNYVARDGLANALTYSARPGHSEHHTGLGMDITTADTADCQKPEIAAVLNWLQDNAWQYGFILRYPEGKTNETGYIYEPWHYRYVGEDLAAKLYNKGDWITMEDYFGVDSEYKY